MSDFWVGTIIGACAAVVFFTVLQLVTVEQNTRLRQEVRELKEMVSEHEEIMRNYEFYNWQYSLKMETEDLK